MVQILNEAIYKLEEDIYIPNTYCVDILVSLGIKIITLANVSMWEQLSLAAFLQKYWADNKVSFTVTFNPKTEGDSLKQALVHLQYQLKSISFLQRSNKIYKQIPYEQISYEQYQKLSQHLLKVDLSKLLMKKSDSMNDPSPENYWDNNNCSR